MNAKTLFAALAATSMAVAYGDPIDSMGFETYGTGEGAVKTVTSGYDDDGQNNPGTSKFYYTGSAEDNESVVTNDVGSYSGSFPQGFDSLGSQVLHLETGSGILFRAINGIESDGDGGYTAKTGESFAGTPLYIDTLVQFTPVEDGAPETSAGDKLAIWLNADDSATNLCVKAGYWTKDGDNVVKTGTTNYPLVVENVNSVVAGKWYRLTVKAIGNVAESHPGFEIYLDGNRVYSTEAASSDSALAANFKEGVNTVRFPSMSANQQISAVGFQGNGAVDDFVVSADMPVFLIHEIEFTLNWDANVTAIQYSIDNGSAQSVSISEGTTNVVLTVPNANSVVKFLYENVTIADKTPAWTTEGSAVDSISADAVTDDYYDEDNDVWYYGAITNGFEYTISAAGAVINLAYTGGSAPAADGWVADSTEIPADTTVATQYPTLASTAFAAVDAKKLTDWANNNSVVFSDTVTTLNGSDSDAIDNIVDAYLLNCAPDDVDDEAEEFTVTITMGADGTPIVTKPNTNSAGEPYNGTVQLQGATSLTGPWTNINAASTDYQFYKCVLSL